MAGRPRVLITADDCNPEWPSLPVVGWKYARAIAAECDVTLATHVRNRENIEKIRPEGLDVRYLDTEYVAAPMHRLALLLRGGNEVAWSANMMMNWLPYLAFEREVWKAFRGALRAGEYDLVHRVTPMSPTLPSPMAGWSPVPFVMGPLNGNLPWPEAFRAEQAREREGLRRLRGLYKLLPYARSARRAACVLAAFEHTVADLKGVDPAKIVMMPEIGFDPEIFHPPAGPRPSERDGRLRFLFAGRLVPYKLPEAAVRAFALSPELRRHVLHVVGDGPEAPRLKALVEEHGLQDCVVFEGRLSQAEVAARMRESDVFVFPSIRELGAGVVIEAMACGMLCVVADYGAPGALAAQGRGLAVPMAPLEALTESLARALERAAADPEDRLRRAAAGRAHAEALYPWAVKGARTRALFAAVLAGAPLGPHGYS